MIQAIEFKENGVRLTFSGIITSKELIEANTELVNHPGFGQLEYQLWIFDPVEDFILSADEMRRIVEQDKAASEKNPGIKVGIYSKSSLVFGLGRMYQGFYGEGPWEVKVFYGLDEAREWLES